MNTSLRNLPLDERLHLVEDLWDSIAADQQALPLPAAQRAELNRRLDAYAADGEPGLPADIEAVRKALIEGKRSGEPQPFDFATFP